MPHDHENDQCAQVDQRDDEFLLALAAIHLDDDVDGVDHEQRDYRESVYAEEGGGDIV